VTLPDPNREIYPNAPLKLVAFELRFPQAPELARPPAQFDKEIKRELPILGPVPQHVTIELQPAGPIATQHIGGGLRRLDRRRRRSIVLTPVNLTVETSSYTRFEEFRGFVAHALHALATSADIPASTRIGLRYIDEIDSKLLSEPVRWDRYIAESLLGAMTHFGTTPVELQTAAVFRPSAEDTVVLRYGIVNQPVVDPAGPLAIADSPAGEYFLIDIDSSWSAPADDLPEFDPDHVLGHLDRLHAPIREAFEASITKELREELLRKEDA
jgi:uncharacterized protein (TIGR04255 family)